MSSIESPKAQRADLADVWLRAALDHLCDAYAVPGAVRGQLLERAPHVQVTAPDWRADPECRHECVASSRLAVLFAALAVEARLNRVLRERASVEWPGAVELPPRERFRLAPRLLGEPESWDHRPLIDLVGKLFELRDELVYGGHPGEPAPLDPDWPFNPSTARAMVEAGADICGFLAALAEAGEQQESARRVHEAARALRLPIRAVAVTGVVADDDFPPDMIGA